MEIEKLTQEQLAVALTYGLPPFEVTNKSDFEEEHTDKNILLEKYSPKIRTTA